MFGTNPIEKLVDHDGSMLHVVEGSPFVTIQGEGPHTGRAAIFIRLHGCPLRCTFCDTEFSGDTDPEWKTTDLVQEVIRLSGNDRKLLVVITGGEPMRQNIAPLCQHLWVEGFTIQIETAGVYWRDVAFYADIVCSPKTVTIHPEILRTAIAFKYVISASDTFEGFIPVTATQPNTTKLPLAAPRDNATVYLSPMDEYDEAKNVANRRKVAELAIKYNVLAGVQLHKFLEVE